MILLHSSSAPPRFLMTGGLPMSFFSKDAKQAPKAKRAPKRTVKKPLSVFLSPVRRIERVAARERICAMTFDDGPCAFPRKWSGTAGRAQGPSSKVMAQMRSRAATRSMRRTGERKTGRGFFTVLLGARLAFGACLASFEKKDIGRPPVIRDGAAQKKMQQYHSRL